MAESRGAQQSRPQQQPQQQSQSHSQSRSHSQSQSQQQPQSQSQRPMGVFMPRRRRRLGQSLPDPVRKVSEVPDSLPDSLDPKAELGLGLVILNYHWWVVDRLRAETKLDEKREKQAKRLRAALENREERHKKGIQRFTRVERLSLERRIREITDAPIKAKERLESYIERSSVLVKEYRDRIQNPNMYSHGLEQGLELIVCRLGRLIEEYCPDIRFSRGAKKGCVRCWSADLTMDEEGMVEYCNACSSVNEICADSGYGESQSRKVYDNTNNFVSAMDAYQGVVKTVPSDELIKEIERNLHRVDPNTVREYLVKNRLGRYYPAVQLIVSRITGKPLPVVENKEAILADAREFDAEYMRISYGRCSTINVQKKLFILLRKNGHDCDEDDFKTPQTPDIRLMQDTRIRTVFDNLGWDRSVL